MKSVDNLREPLGELIIITFCRIGCKINCFIEEQAATEAEKEHWRFRPQVDTGEYVDTAVAQRAGLGFIGKMVY